MDISAYHCSSRVLFSKAHNLVYLFVAIVTNRGIMKNNPWSIRDKDFELLIGWEMGIRGRGWGEDGVVTTKKVDLL